MKTRPAWETVQAGLADNSNFDLHSASSSALCRGSATYQPVADARDQPEHDERGVGPALSVVWASMGNHAGRVFELRNSNY
ncbi:hypothetical protein CO657_31850 (plasmid) [Rhizobium acidisoli]|uniref:Uncharacterized protein n=1 Tax=Rhizobium acidisoli TaxID=1538158 RepID=A0AAE5WU11_9HYPH|nr:hypothetical protein CO657_31850 [Rhizobium acidisoli]